MALNPISAARSIFHALGTVIYTVGEKLYIPQFFAQLNRPKEDSPPLDGRVKQPKELLTDKEWEEIGKLVENEALIEEAQHNDLSALNQLKQAISEMNSLHGRVERAIDYLTKEQKVPIPIKKGGVEALLSRANDVEGTKKEKHYLIKAYRLKSPEAAARLAHLERSEEKRRQFLIDAETFSSSGGYIELDFVNTLGTEAKKGSIKAKKQLEALAKLERPVGYRAAYELYELTNDLKLLGSAGHGRDVKAMRKLYELSGDPIYAKAAAVLGDKDLAYHLGVTDQEFLELAAELGHPDALFELAIEQDQNPFASEQVARAAYLGSAAANCFLGKSYFDQGDLERAGLFFTRAADLGSKEAMKELGFLLFNDKREEAIRYLIAADDPEAAHIVGQNFFLEERYDEALPFLEHARGFGYPVSSEIKKIASSAKDAQTVQRAKELLIEEMENANDLVELGKSYLKVESPHHAEQCFERAAYLGHPQGLIELGKMHERTGENERAAELYIKALERGISDSDAQVARRRLNVLRFLKSKEAHLYLADETEIASQADKMYPKAAFLHAKNLMRDGKGGYRLYLGYAASNPISEAKLLYAELLLSEETESAKNRAKALLEELESEQHPGAYYLLGVKDNDKALIKEAARRGEPRALYALAKESKGEEKEALLQRALLRLGSNDPLFVQIQSERKKETGASLPKTTPTANDALFEKLEPWTGNEEQIAALSTLKISASPEDADRIFDLARQMDNLLINLHEKETEEMMLLAARVGSDKLFREEILPKIEMGVPFDEYGDLLFSFAKSSHSEANLQLAKFLDSAEIEGVYATGKKMDEEAYPLYELCLSNGDRRAADPLILMLQQGRGCKANDEQALRLAFRFGRVEKMSALLKNNPLKIANGINTQDPFSGEILSANLHPSEEA